MQRFLGHTGHVYQNRVYSCYPENHKWREFWGPCKRCCFEEWNAIPRYLPGAHEKQHSFMYF